MQSKKDLAVAKGSASVLRSGILSGELMSGMPLRESSLIQDLGVSRNTLRGAFVQLSIEGLTEQQLYKGTVVRRIAAEEIRDIFVARRTLELRAIDQSSYATATSLQPVCDALMRSHAAADRQAWTDAGTASLQFHQAIVAILGSRSLNALFEVLSPQLRLAFASFADKAEHQASWLPRDAEICEMLMHGRRGEALSAMERYLDESERSLLDALRFDRFLQVSLSGGCPDLAPVAFQTPRSGDRNQGVDSC